MNNHKEELLNMYLIECTDLYYVWENNFSSSDEERVRMKQSFNNKLKKFKELLENS